MSTAHGIPAETTPPEIPPADDPFRYGWRYVPDTKPDGTEGFKQIPLTLRDLLFPREGDFRVQTDMHDEDCLYLKTVLKARLADDPHAIVLSDCRIDFNVEGLEPLGPDVAVLLDHRRPRRDWGTYDLADEGSRPAMVAEITSPDTRNNDVKLKLKFYHQAKVPYYLIADIRPVGGLRRMRLEGYRWTADRYKPMPLDKQGRLRFPTLNIWVGKKTVEVGERLVCYDPETGEEIGDYEQISHRLKEAEAKASEAEAKAAAEAQMRLELEMRLQEMEKLLRSQRPSSNGSSN